jgi:hypothetical protein
MKRHELNVSHLVFGLAFLGIAACWAVTEAGLVDARAGWLVPMVLVVAGAVGLVASLAKGLSRPAAAESYATPWTDDRMDDRVDDRLDDGNDDRVDDPLDAQWDDRDDRTDHTAVQVADLPDDEEPTRRL